MIGGKQKPNAQTFKDKAMKKIINTPAEALPPSATQNPTPAGGDGTPVDSELELANKAYAKEKFIPVILRQVGWFSFNSGLIVNYLQYM